MNTSVPEPVCLTPQPGHFTFGYYDRQPWSPDLRYHLALNIPQQDHLPTVDETAGVGVIDMQAGAYAFTRLTETRAWNHQQGSMTLWLPHEPGTFMFNDAVKEGRGWHLVTRVWNIDNGEVRQLPRPVYALAPDGRTAATLDFGRIGYRKGYSYAAADSMHGPNLPDDAGVWTMDTVTGEARLIASIRAMAAMHPHAYELNDVFVWLNHIIWNCDGSRLMALFRYRIGEKGWKTFMYTMRSDGSDLVCSLPHVYWQGVSHQIWGRTPREVLLDADWRGRGAELIVLREGQLTFDLLAPGVTGPNGHLVFSPDGQWIAADSYPLGTECRQKLRLVHAATGRVVDLGSYYHAPVADTNVRCDLHPRWRLDGRALSFDSKTDGERRIYMINLEGVI